MAVIEKEIPKLMMGPWRLAVIPKCDGPKVFSTFSCAGGSSMGYKLAGCNVIGCLEIDPEMNTVYDKNLNPKISFNESIQNFNEKPELWNDLKGIDILDGSPPCSVFSIAGKREEKWGAAHDFNEGRTKQRLDDLFLHFIKSVDILKPKIAVAENVEGMLLGNAKGYVKEILLEFQKIGYTTQIFLLDASAMGVPQRRRRVFFISRRKELGFKNITMEFHETPITFGEATKDLTDIRGSKTPPKVVVELVRNTVPGDNLSRAHPRGSYFNAWKAHYNKPLRTLAPNPILRDNVFHPNGIRTLSTMELVRGQTFPDDYNFGSSKPGYVIGMSVPPFMMQRIALEIRRQWLW